MTEVAPKVASGIGDRPVGLPSPPWQIHAFP
jgi:hypothetical protein